jgi:2-keto-3-deoxy-L-rhamnonate aldolase RhmA
MIFIGPRDLSANIGKLNRMEDPELRSLIAKFEQATLKSGKARGTIAATGAVAKQLFDRGYGFVIAGSDLVHLRTSIAQMMKDAGRS